MHYIHQNKDNVETKINICELRNAYAKSINRSYEFKRYNDNIYIDACDAKRIVFYDE